jgi:hypothetical protein
MACGHAGLAIARSFRRCRRRRLARSGLGGPGQCGGLIWGVGTEGDSPRLAVHGGVRAAGVLNGGRPEGRSLASEEMSVSSRTPTGCWRRWWPGDSVLEAAHPWWGGQRWRTSKVVGIPRRSSARRCEQSTRTARLETLQGAWGQLRGWLKAAAHWAWWLQRREVGGVIELCPMGKSRGRGGDGSGDWRSRP